MPMLGNVAANVIPPLVMLTLLLVVWELLCNRPGATLPPPTKIWSEARDLIVDPFFVAGPQDIGLGWRVLTSLQRVAIGYGLAGVIGIMLGTLIGQSMWAMRGLDPIFQVLRTISPLAWLPISLAAFRDSQPSAIFVIFITVGLADHHQHRGRHPQHPAGLPQRRGGAAAQSSRVLLEDHDPVGGALHLHGAAHRHRPVMARDRRRRDADRRRRHRLLHLGRVELVAHPRHRRGARLHRPDRLRARPHRRRRRQHSSPAARPPAEDTDDELPISRSITSTKSSTAASRETEVLKDVTLSVEKGEYVSIIGHSGCGKTTLLNIVAGLTPVTHWRRAAGEPGGQRAGPGSRGRVPEPLAAAVAHGLRQRAPRGGQGVLRHALACRARPVDDAQSRARPDGARQGQAAGGNLRRHEAARRARPRARDGAEGAAARRAVRRARCAHPRASAGLGDGDPPEARQHRA